MTTNIEQLLEVSNVLGSGKRAILLMMLNGKPMSYTDMDKKFRKLEMKIGSSEIYKHLEILLRFKYIVKRGRTYIVTLKGKKLIEGLETLVDVPPTVPRLELVF